MLVAVLNDDRRLFPMIQALAYQAYQSPQDGKAVTDLPRGTALVLLSRPEYLGNAGLAEAFLEYVEHRAGLLGPTRDVQFSTPDISGVSSRLPSLAPARHSAHAVPACPGRGILGSSGTTRRRRVTLQSAA
jgi:hypothetical protein